MDRTKQITSGGGRGKNPSKNKKPIYVVFFIGNNFVFSAA
jgi:hypothetical protein